MTDRKPATPRVVVRYDADVHTKLGLQFTLLGADDKRLAFNFGVNERTVRQWKVSHPEFNDALKKGKDETDATVVVSLLTRARGFSRPGIKPMIVRDAAGAQTIVDHPISEYFPPDVSAAIHWLKNRQPDLWRDLRVSDDELPGTPSDVARALRDAQRKMMAADNLDPTTPPSE